MPLSVVLVVLAYGLGVGPVPNALLGEMLPLKIKSFAIAIIMSLK